MAKNLFRSREVSTSVEKVVLESPFEEEAEEVEVESIEEYSGPTADDLRREAEAFKKNWEQEKQQMIEAAQEEADRIVKDAEQKAFNEVQRKTEEAQSTRQEAENEASRIIEEARRDARIQQEDAQKQVDGIKDEAYKEGFDAGREAGYVEGKKEVDRLIEHLHHIIDMTLEKRNEIIEETETQLIQLVLIIVKKVVKVISENQKNVVINNVIQALRKLKSRGEVLVKVNLDDVELTSEHVKDFMRMVDNVQSVTVVEDSTVDKGGCIIETDFGEIDARISSQLHEIEEKILELSPIQSRGEK